MKDYNLLTVNPAIQISMPIKSFQSLRDPRVLCCGSTTILLSRSPDEQGPDIGQMSRTHERLGKLDQTIREMSCSPKNLLSVVVDEAKPD